MSIPPSHSTSDVDTSPAGERLESWKEIAAYLNRSVRTLHRWEKEEGLPVHRQLHKELGSVFAYKSELDAWSRARSVRTEVRENTKDPGSPNRSRMVVTVALAGAVVLIGSLSYLVARGSRPERSGQDAYLASLELISTFSGSHRWPSLSPDGRWLAFVSDAGGTPQVWIKNLATGEPVQLTFGDIPASRPRWSPQGDRIVYSTSAMASGPCRRWAGSLARSSGTEGMRTCRAMDDVWFSREPERSSLRGPTDLT